MPGSDIIQSLAAGMDVLVFLAEAENGLRVKDVAEKVGVKPAVAHNLLRTLRVKGFVQRDMRAPVYRLGPRLAEILSRQNGQALFQNVENAMSSLLSALPDATITFTQPLNGEIMVVRRLNANDYGIVQKPSGFSLGLYASASGLAMMAFCSEECYLSLQQHHPFLDEGGHIWSPPATFDQCLDKIRRQGHAVHPYVDEKRLAVACPIYDERHHLTGVLGASRTAAKGQTFDDDALATTIEHLKAAAMQVCPKDGTQQNKAS
ncbi:MAG: helix-turn-helix domain-containing protein [Candidatus Pacebacteria bacterium]|nr:helix-turn-helix domain-containing protein [Candidatus Paceibacterota bacterium]